MGSDVAGGYGQGDSGHGGSGQGGASQGGLSFNGSGLVFGTVNQNDGGRGGGRYEYRHKKIDMPTFDGKDPTVGSCKLRDTSPSIN